MDNDNYVTITDEGIAEINPTASSEMQQAFIDKYRQIQGENTAQIGAQTHALGSDLPAQLGGLHGPSEYMKSRYQTPQTESRVAALRTASQLSALNQLMQNDQNRWNERYNQAYRNYQKRKNSGGDGGGGGDDDAKPDVEILGTGQGEKSLRSSGPGTTTVWDMSYNSKTGEPGYKVMDTATNQTLKESSSANITNNTPSRVNWWESAIAATPIGAINSIINTLIGRF